MEAENYYEYEELLSQQQDQTEEEDKQGARLNLSQLSAIAEAQEKGTQIVINESKDHIQKELVQETFDIQTRNLVNFSQIYKRADQFNRLPTSHDFTATYPSYPVINLSDLSLLAQDKTVKDKKTLDERIIQFWTLWKDSHILPPAKERKRFGKTPNTPKHAKSSIIPPSEIKQIWRDNPIMKNSIKDIQENISRKQNPIEADVNKSVLLSDIQTILNMDLETNRLQISPLIHSLRIPLTYPNEPMNIILYKTYELPDTPQQIPESQKLQLFLDAIAVKMTIDPIIAQNGITHTSQWDSIHQQQDMQFPRLAKENIAFTNQFIKKVTVQDILNQSFEYKPHDYCMQHSLVLTLYNPITNQKLDINPRDIYLGDHQEIYNTIRKIDKITGYYISNKNELSKVFRPKPAHYRLPVFSKNTNDKEDPTQIALDLFGSPTK